MTREHDRENQRRHIAGKLMGHYWPLGTQLTPQASTLLASSVGTLQTTRKGLHDNSRHLCPHPRMARAGKGPAARERSIFLPIFPSLDSSPLGPPPSWWSPDIRREFRSTFRVLFCAQHLLGWRTACLIQSSLCRHVPNPLWIPRAGKPTVLSNP